MSAVQASVSVLRWAAQRSRRSEEGLRKKFKKWPQWLSGEAYPTLKQLEQFSDYTHTPFGYFFLSEPPEIKLPVADFRTLRNAAIAEPSLELLDTLYQCQSRQHWYREYAQSNGFEPLDFVACATVEDSPEAIATQMRQHFGLLAEEREGQSRANALRRLITKAEDAGVLVMVNGVVANNTHRKLEVAEFRGFALADKLAPLVFLNGADSKSAQMFTLAHELAHLWLGISGVSDSAVGEVSDKAIERWCNRAAVELLMPLADLVFMPAEPLALQLERLSEQFKVSTLVVLRRLFEAGHIHQKELWSCYQDQQRQFELKKLITAQSGGGDFYKTLPLKVSKNFIRALAISTFEQGTLFRDAFRLLGIKKATTFHKAAEEVGVSV